MYQRDGRRNTKTNGYELMMTYISTRQTSPRRSYNRRSNCPDQKVTSCEMFRRDVVSNEHVSKVIRHKIDVTEIAEAILLMIVVS
jgi:hypothetical protein